MAIRQRLALCFSVPLILAVSLGGTQLAASAQGPPGFRPAGNYGDTSMLGSLFFNAADGSQSIFLFVNRQIVVATPPAPSSISSDETTLFLNVQAPSVNCFISDNGNEFKVAPDAQSASLHLTISQASCGALTSDVTLDVTWIGAGPIQLTTTSSRFSCSGYTAETHGSDIDHAGVATFNLTGLAAPITTPGPQTFHLGSFGEHVQGAVPPDTCRASVGFKGAGRPTPAAGNYETTVRDASLFSVSGGFLSLDARASGSSSDILRGTSTSTSETDVDFSLSSLTVNAGGCFKIDPADLVVSSSTASLHTVLTSGANNGCGGSATSISPDPFPVDVSWVGTSPVATTSTDTHFSCLGYHFQTQSTQVAIGVADVAVSMPGLTTTLTAVGNLGTVDTKTHADGTPAAGCFFRG